jgi:hypothetical protein
VTRLVVVDEDILVRRQASHGEDGKLDIVLNITEQNGNQFTPGGGGSGLEDMFMNPGFITGLTTETSQSDNIVFDGAPMLAKDSKQNYP